MTGAELLAEVQAEMATNGGQTLEALCTVLAPYLSAGGKVTGLDGDQPMGAAVGDTENPGG